MYLEVRYSVKTLKIYFLFPIRTIVERLSPLFADGESLESLCRKTLDELNILADEYGIFGRTKLKFSKAFAVGGRGGAVEQAERTAR